MFQARVLPSRIDNNNNTDREEKRREKTKTERQIKSVGEALGAVIVIHACATVF